MTTMTSTSVTSGGDTPAPLREVRGVVERTIFENRDNGYTIARLAPERPDAEVTLASGGDQLITVVGTLIDLTPGEAIVASGWWRNDPKYGWQFAVVDYRTALPATLQGMQRYLGSGMVKGIGPIYAARIVEAFGEETFDVIDATPERLTGVAGIGKVRAERIATAWAEQRQIREVMAALHSYGVSTSLAVRIYKKFGGRSAQIVTEEPYRLAREVWGIGFKTADKIAACVGIARDAPARLQAGALHALGMAAEEGHTLLTESLLVQRSADLLEAGPEPIRAASESLVASGDLVVAVKAGDPERLFSLAPFARAESGLAARLRALVAARAQSRAQRTFTPVDWAVVFTWLAQRHQITLSEEQEAAVRMALTEPVAILTGGPGTGKTHTLGALLTVARAKGLRCLLAAPTGRAAKRMEEATGLPAATLHRLLEIRPGSGASFGPDQPLSADLVVVDEASMLDVLLANQLVKALAPGTHLLLVGDPDQLPSVGAGDVLADLIGSRQFPVTRLSRIFRQGPGSGIARDAERIKVGLSPRFGRDAADCFFVEAETPAAAADLVVELVAERLPRRYGFARGEVQVLAPMHRGEAGVGALNARLQERLNPARAEVPEVRSGGRAFRVGDRVLQLRNDYDLKVFNGDLGTVGPIDLVEQEVVVHLDDGRDVRYPVAALFALTHAYAVSVHKCIAGYERVRTANRGLIPVEQVRVGDLVYTSDHSTRPVLSVVETGERPVIRVTTRMGYQLDVSPEHPILVADDGPPRFVPVRAIQLGQFACLSRQVVAGDNSVLLPRVELDSSAQPLCLPAAFDEDLAWLLGVTIGDGSYRDRRDGTVDFTSQDAEVLTRYRTTLEGYGLRVGTYRDPGRRVTRLYVVSRTFRKWLLQLGLDYVTASEKTVPALIFRAHPQVRAAFLRGLFDTDGSAGKGATRSCRLVTSSRQLAAEVQELLLSLGIVSYQSQTTERAWCVGVSGTSLPQFAQWVGFSVAYKQQRLDAVLSGRDRSRTHTTNVDSVPFAKLVAREVADHLRTFWGPTKGRHGQGIFGGWLENRRTPRRHRAEAYRNLCSGQGLTYARLRDLHAGREDAGTSIPVLLRETQEANFFYDRIVASEPTGKRAVMYDLEVEGVHAFVSNGFVCHNSQGAEFPAVVLPLLTSHAPMLGRTLLYTAFTRAKQLVVLVGQRRALQLAVRDWRRTARSTSLGGLLLGTLELRWRGRPASSTGVEDELAESWEGLIMTNGAP
jgi:exodeoxyribonuclease V alpha subunit